MKAQIEKVSSETGPTYISIMLTPTTMDELGLILQLVTETKKKDLYAWFQPTDNGGGYMQFGGKLTKFNLGTMEVTK